MKVKSFAKGKSFENRVGVPVAGGPVKDLTLLNNFMETSADLLKRSGIIVEVGIKNIDILKLQSFEGVGNTFFDVLSVGGGRRVQIRIWISSDFGGDDDIFSGDIEILENAAEGDLSLSSSVKFGSVKVVDAVAEADFDDIFVFLVGLGLVVDHISERNDGDS
jgi:hypothetical protein